MKLPGLFVIGAVLGLAAGVGAGAFLFKPKSPEAGAAFGGAEAGGRGGQGPAMAAGPGGRGGPGAGGQRAGGPGAGGPGGGRQGAGGPSSFMRGGMPPAITTAAVEPASVGRTLDAIGSGRAARSVSLVSEATGLVTRVGPRAGGAVKAGDVILALDDEAQRIAVARARAAYPVARANSERYAALQKENAASRLEADAAFNAWKAAEAELRAAEYALGQRTIRAPFDGVVGLTTLEPGQYVRAGDVVTTIDDLSSLIIEFTAPQEAAAEVKVGQKVTATLAGASRTRIEGAVSAIDSRVDAASRTFRIEATFANPGGALLPGATFAVSTTNESARALAAPGLAVQWDRTGAYVWKLAPDGSASRANVQIVQRRDELALLEGEIKAGDIVIVEGADRVRPGMSFPVGDRSARGTGREGAAPQRPSSAGVSAVN